MKSPSLGEQFARRFGPANKYHESRDVFVPVGNAIREVVADPLIEVDVHWGTRHDLSRTLIIANREFFGLTLFRAGVW